MTTMNTNERAERLKQIRERLAAHRTEAAKYHNREWAKGDALHYYEAPDDVETLLSLLDSQAAVATQDHYFTPTLVRDSCAKCGKGTSEHPGHDQVATRMRDKCVDRVKVRRAEKQAEADAKRDPDNPCEYHGSYGLAVGAVDVCDDLTTDLQSLTLDQVEQKEAK